jgi:hypothetical protein
VLTGALLSPIPAEVRLGAAAVLTLVVLAAARGLWGLRLPQTERQIPASVVALRLPSRAWRFALTYGTGLFTYLPSAAPHVLVVWLTLAAPSHLAMLGAVAFGVGRGLDLLMRSCSVQRVAYEDAFQRVTQAVRPATPYLVAALAVVAVAGA